MKSVEIKKRLTGCEDIKIRMGGQGPEPSLLSPERLCAVLFAKRQTLTVLSSPKLATNMFWMENSAIVVPRTSSESLTFNGSRTMEGTSSPAANEQMKMN
jgi:hypothetical protein